MSGNSWGVLSLLSKNACLEVFNWKDVQSAHSKSAPWEWTKSGKDLEICISSALLIWTKTLLLQGQEKGQTSAAFRVWNKLTALLLHQLLHPSARSCQRASKANSPYEKHLHLSPNFCRQDFHLQFLNCCHDSRRWATLVLIVCAVAWTTGYPRIYKDGPWCKRKLNTTLWQSKQMIIFSNSDADILCFLSSGHSSASCSHHHRRQGTSDAKTWVWWAFRTASKQQHCDLLQQLLV